MAVSSPSTSLSLLDRLCARDAQAWRQMVVLYAPLLHAWLRPAGLQASDIDDVTQNALMIVVRKLPEYRHNGHPGAFRAWLRSIVQKCLRDFLRATDRHEARLLELRARLDDPGSDLHRWWDREHDRYVLRGLLELVAPEFTSTTWTAFYRTALEGAAPGAIAAELGLSPNAIHIARSRVLARLREAAREFVDSD
jgi:RNA polymerase sigma-70 factor (ECF subfamily)